MAIDKALWGKTSSGEQAELFTLSNSNGMIAKISNYGGIITELHVPDKHGDIADVVLGFDSLAEYEEKSPYFGAVIGRYANRIAGGKFTLNGKEYTLAVNEFPKRNTHLHGGVTGFDKVIWDAKAYENSEGAVLELSYRSKDGEEGYPGNLNVKTIYILTPDNSLRMTFSATTDQDTVVNMTNHSYFNLSGEGSGTILDHQVKINANAFTPVNHELIPTGEMLPLDGTPLDFRISKSIGRDINADFEQLRQCGGFDHNFVIDRKADNTLAWAVEVYEPTSGRRMEVYTTQPGVQFYAGNCLSEKADLFGKSGHFHPAHSGFCFETQHFPDSPNQPHFPSTVLKAGNTYCHTAEYKFSAI
ncbi:MAG: galactose mutarotase [Victivallales bacterium]|nr:galactose mutarotase [Victivallales bacterium]